MVNGKSEDFPSLFLIEKEVRPMAKVTDVVEALAKPIVEVKQGQRH